MNIFTIYFIKVNFIKKFLILFLLIFTTSCSSYYIKTRGHVLDSDDLKEIKVGLTSKDNVLNLIDYPSFYSLATNNRWIYVSYKVEEKMFFKPKLIESKIVVIDFEDEIVKNMTVSSIKPEDIKMTDAETSIKDEDESWFRDIIDNIGAFSLSN